jgi:glyoxylase I family protein
MIGQLQHVAVGVRNLKEAVAFYTGVLGLSVIHTAHHEGDVAARISGVRDAHIEVCVVGSGGSRIELLQYAGTLDDGENHVEQNSIGVTHICFEVSDIEKEFERIQGLGYVFYSPPLYGRVDGPRVCYFKGPDNVVIELLEPRPREEARNKVRA